MDITYGKKRLTEEGAFSPFNGMGDYGNLLCFVWGLLCAWAVIQGLNG